MFERQDLLSTQFAMRGKSKWPVMFKGAHRRVRRRTPKQAKADALEMAKYARQWLGDRTADGANSRDCLGP